MNTKYVKTKEGSIIVFSAAVEHKQFANLQPVSAGFITFGFSPDVGVACKCFGESTSLGLKSDEEEDARLANQQITRGC